jgi:TonB family protein
MRLFALTALVLVPTAAFAQAANQTTLQASVSKPVAFVSAAAAPTATPVVAIASAAGYHDVVKASLTAADLDQAQAEGGMVSYTFFGSKDSKADFIAPKLVSVVGRKLPLDQANNTAAAVTVAFVVDNHGIPADFKIVRSGGSAAVDQSTIEALRQYRYKPATLNDLPVYAHLTMEIKLEK